MLLFVLYLLFANNIVFALFSDSYQLKPVMQEDFNTVFIEHFIVADKGIRNDMFDNFFITGWTDADFKSLDAVLIGTGGWYSAPLTIGTPHRGIAGSFRHYP